MNSCSLLEGKGLFLAMGVLRRKLKSQSRQDRLSESRETTAMIGQDGFRVLVECQTVQWEEGSLIDSPLSLSQSILLRHKETLSLRKNRLSSLLLPKWSRWELQPCKLWAIFHVRSTEKEKKCSDSKGRLRVLKSALTLFEKKRKRVERMFRD